MLRELDALTAPTLKYLRERWWDDAFARFLADSLDACPGNRVLDVGCGPGTAERAFAALGISGLSVVGVDVSVSRVREAASGVPSDGTLTFQWAAGDGAALPFGRASFDSTFCVAVLQHANALAEPIREFARVTRAGGRILVVEPDNSGRYWYSSAESGMQAFEIGSRFYNAVALSRGDTTDPAVGPKLAQLFWQHGIRPRSVRVFPVSQARIGTMPWAMWENRLETARVTVDEMHEASIRRLGLDYCRVLERYAEEAAAAGPDFIEVQTTLLYATAGTRMAE
ncbi:MAG: class I SAM-dependent methyltransferase [Bacteroidales bacterium]